MVIYYGAQGTGLPVMEYLWRYYIMQGMDMIPYQEAITQNLLSDFVLTSESLTLSEWAQLTADIFHNFSIVRFDISGQQTLEVALWRNLFEGLATNNLSTLRLRDCFMFHPDNLIAADTKLSKLSKHRQSAKHQKESALDLPSLRERESLLNPCCSNQACEVSKRTEAVECSLRSPSRQSRRRFSSNGAGPS